MSKKTIRNNFARWFGAAACASILFAGCATKGDGDGSETHFLCTADSDCVPHGDGYRCVERQCTTVAGPEGGATAMSDAANGITCADDTRSTPYSPGMVVTGSAGFTVALTSTPAPPSLGDNTWTFFLKDGVGVPLDGATITAQQKMVDHGHSGSKRIVVTDLGSGNYRAAPVNFNMGGYWETTLHIVKTPVDDVPIEDDVVITLCVQ